MNAAHFYQAFDAGWSSVSCDYALKRLSGAAIRWKAITPAGGLMFTFATNPKCAGLVPHLPGEFRLGIAWSHKKDGKTYKDEVSLFQYSTDEDAAGYASLQRSALEKFLAQPGKESLRSIFNYTSDANWLPRANFEEFAYYVDREDAECWGRWYGARIGGWIARFTASPESFNDWCWRVLWADSVRPQ